MRLNKYIALCGVTSRRGSDELIAQGKVTVNGSIVTTMGPDIDIDNDIVCVGGLKVSPEKEHVYIMLNKPAGYISACSDDRGRKTVIDLVEDTGKRIFPVGRLDYDTEGLLILTSDGDFAYRCTHPRHEVSKKYFAIVHGALDDKDVRRLRDGVIIDGKKTSEAGVEISEKKDNTAKVYITIHEGRNRHVKKMFESVGCSVAYLKRVSVGRLELGDLPLGKWRYLNGDDLKTLGVTVGKQPPKQRK